MMRISTVGAVLATAVISCAGGGENELRARASYDLNCPPESLAMTQLQEKNFLATTEHGATYGVAGCGQRATYVNNVGTWVLNNREGAAHAVSPPQPAPVPVAPPSSSSSDTRL